MSLVLTPNELLLLIVRDLTPAALLSLMLCNKRLFLFGVPVLNSHAINSPYYKTAAIFVATITRNKELLKPLLETGFPIYVISPTYPYHQRVLHVAPSPCAHVTLQRVLSSGISLQLSSTFSNDVALPALSWAAKNNHVALLELALRSGANMEWQSQSGETVLLVALRLGHKTIALRLLKSGVDVTRSDYSGTCPLDLAVEKCGDAVKAILRLGADPNRRDCRGVPILHHAVAAGNEDVVKLLLEYRANPNMRNMESATSLHVAARRADMAGIVRLLLDYGASSLATDNSLKTPFQVAEECGNPVVGLLLEGLYVAHPAMKRTDGRTFLHLAAFHCCPKLVRQLLSVGINPNARDNSGKTPLHLAAGNFDSNISTMLAGAGASIDAADITGNTPLHIVAKGPDLALFWELVLLGERTCFSLRNNDGYSPLHLAAHTVSDPNGEYETNKGSERGAESRKLWERICEAERMLFGEILERRRALRY